MLPDAVASTVNACAAAPVWPMAACGSTLWASGKDLHNYVYTMPLRAVGYSTVVVKMESRRVGRGGAEEEQRGDKRVRLMSTSSVLKLPIIPWAASSPVRIWSRICPRSRPGNFSSLRQTVSSHPESLHSKVPATRNHPRLPSYTKPYAPDTFLGT